MTPSAAPVDRPTRPGTWPTVLIRVSTRVLPAGSVRRRYRQELLAELYGMDGKAQARYAGGVLSRCWALRMAVTRAATPPSEETLMHKPILCRLNLHHSWQTFSAEDGGRYRQCARCGKEYPGAGGPVQHGIM